MAWFVWAFTVLCGLAAALNSINYNATTYPNSRIGGATTHNLTKADILLFLAERIPDTDICKYDANICGVGMGCDGSWITPGWWLAYEGRIYKRFQCIRPIPTLVVLYLCSDPPTCNSRVAIDFPFGPGCMNPDGPKYEMTMTNCYSNELQTVEAFVFYPFYATLYCCGDPDEHTRETLMKVAQ